MTKARGVTILGAVAALAIIATAGFAVAQSLNFSGSPNFGTHNVTPGFVPDPINVTVTSGGNLNVAGMGLGPGCVGWATSQPDVRVRLQGHSNHLRFYVTSGTDTTLVVNTANSQWVCNDDSWGGNNPTVDINGANPGQYDIWIGSYQQGQQAHAVLHITELDGNHP